MGLFDSLGGMLENAVNNHPGGMSGLLTQALGEVGGLDGVVNKLNEAGYGSKVNSWLGQGDNTPLSADEVRSALSNEYLAKVAAQLGVPMDRVAGVLADHLPKAVDHASPDGTIQS